MTPEEWSLVKEILNHALECAPGQQEAYLQAACGGDHELRKQVEALIAADGDTWELFDSPAAQNSDALVPRLPTTGERIGAYEILREIGHGGMGVVYLARRADEQFEQRVAIKLARVGSAGDWVERRFLAERQIVAGLDHPNIARLLDGGATLDGRPYLVMEYVEGMPLGQWCDSRNLGTHDRLRIFLDVCSAVQYAHQHLVVHRDLKPGNILVTEEGTVKLLDFGIAKLIGPDLSGAGADRTSSLLRILTPDYASPEQVRGDPISTASDVYALGVVLYELLSSQKPYRVSDSAPLELLAIICEGTPLRPSQAAKGPVSKELAGDLDAIVLTALRKEPNRRYASVTAMAEDIRRFLNGLPVEARGETFGYRSGKFVRRHRGSVAAAALLLAALVGGLVWNLREARRARAAEARAEKRFDDVRSLARSLIFEIHDSVADLSGATPARKIIVQRALTYLDSLARESAGDPGLSRELAAGYQRIGDVQGSPNSANLGDSGGALKSYRKALELREALAKRQPHDQEIQRELAGTLESLGDVLGTAGDWPGQLDAYRRSLAVREALVAADPKGTASRSGLAASYHRIASVLVDQGKYREALDMWHKEMEIFEALLRETPNDARAQRNVALSFKYAGGTLERLSERAAALDLYRKAVALDEARSNADPTNASARIDLSFSYGALGQCLSSEGDLDGAIQSYGKALAIREALVAADPKNANARLALSKAYLKMGLYLFKKGDGPAARDSCLKGLRIVEAICAEDPANKSARAFLGSALEFLGDVETAITEAQSTPPSDRRGHREKACSAYEKSLMIWNRLRDERTLSAQDAREPEETAAALERCQKALQRH